MYTWAGQPEEFYKNFSLVIESGSMHAGSRDRVKQMAIILHRQGAISLRELHRTLEIANSDQIIKEIREEHQGGIGIPPGKGGANKMSRGAKNGKPM
jgi:hypothetical protein